jgi:ferredoxin--NADP+ reductase
VVIGNGNVALDVARMLALNPAELEVTDTADHAIAALKASNVREIVILGRRGPAQAAYTNPELRELPDLADADIVVDAQDMELDEGSRAWLERDGTPTAKRNVEILTDYAQRELKGHHKRIVFRFLRSPVEILGTDRVEGLKVVRNELVAAEDGSMRARASEDFETIETGLVLRSIGYKGSPVDGVPFDDRRATFANDGGRILDPESGRPRPGVYAAGWIKRGPSGVIGTNKKCAQETVALLFDDLAAGKLPEPQAAPEDLLRTLAGRGVRVVDYDGWESIDEHERSTGEPLGRPRVKLVRREHLLEKAFAGRG